PAARRGRERGCKARWSWSLSLQQEPERDDAPLPLLGEQRRELPLRQSVHGQAVQPPVAGGVLHAHVRQHLAVLVHPEADGDAGLEDALLLGPGREFRYLVVEHLAVGERALDLHALLGRAGLQRRALALGRL